MISEIDYKELAKFLGKTKGWANHITTGRKKLPFADCFRVSKHFGIPLYELRDEFPRSYTITDISKDIIGPIPTNPP